MMAAVAAPAPLPAACAAPDGSGSASGAGLGITVTVTSDGPACHCSRGSLSASLVTQLGPGLWLDDWALMMWPARRVSKAPGTWPPAGGGRDSESLHSDIIESRSDSESPSRCHGRHSDIGLAGRVTCGPLLASSHK